MQAWNDGKLPQVAGKHRSIGFIDEPTMVKGGDDQFYFVSILVNPTVVQICHLVKLGIEELSGFYNLQLKYLRYAYQVPQFYAKLHKNISFGGQQQDLCK